MSENRFLEEGQNVMQKRSMGDHKNFFDHRNGPQIWSILLKLILGSQTQCLCFGKLRIEELIVSRCLFSLRFSVIN